MKTITYILLLLLGSACSQSIYTDNEKEFIQNKNIIHDEKQEEYDLTGNENCGEIREEIYLYLRYGAEHIDEIIRKKPIGIYNNCYDGGHFSRTKIVLFINELDSTNLLELQKSSLIQGRFHYNLDIEINSIKSSEDLYNLIKYINRNTSISEIRIKIEDQTLKIDEKLFSEILQNSRFVYTLNLDFSEDLEEIDILRGMHGSNIQSVGFNNYGRGDYFDDFYFRDLHYDTVYFTYEGKRAEFNIIDGEESFNYFEGPGSERIPFEYGE